DFCACEECRSVLSPAAYLVDLLHFLDREPESSQSTTKRNPQTVLLERRPDLQHLPLTCENTNTPLPYIDVVNETLEYFIANHDRGASSYGWREVLMETVGLSREEHEILTDSTAVPLRRMFGFAAETTEQDVIAALSNTKLFCRRVGISYDELIAILQTCFVN